MKATFKVNGIEYTIGAKTKNELRAVIAFIACNTYDAMERMKDEGCNATAEMMLKVCRGYWDKMDELKA